MALGTPAVPVQHGLESEKANGVGAEHKQIFENVHEAAERGHVATDQYETCAASCNTAG